jgi:hypothetical protein
MTKLEKLEKQVQLQQKICEFKMQQAMAIVLKHQDTMTADCLVREARKLEIPAGEISRLCGGIMKRYRKEGFLIQLNTFKLSERGSRRPLPEYSIRRAK